MSSSLWNDATVPTIAAVASAPAEVGVRFSSDTDGYITGLKFYKGPGNTGVHVGSLWNTAGVALGRATFQNETAGGWQQVDFASPVPVTAGTTYVASYLARNGNFSVDEGYFAAAGVDSGPLHAAQDAVGAPNGLYTFSGVSAFPTVGNNARNYWVDVVFDTAFAPKVSSVQAFDGEPDGIWDANVTARFNGAMDPSTVNGATVQLRDAADAAVPAAVTYDAASKLVTIDPTSPLTTGATYTVFVQGGATGVHSATGTALAADYTSSFDATETQVYGVWAPSATPAVANWDDSRAVELGVKFRTDSAGFVTGVRFYKGTNNSGTHTGSLWTSSGTLLASATFSDETATGWQQVSFGSPVAVSPGATYVASYYAPVGNYSVDVGGFAARGEDRGALHALRDGVSGGNGVFVYSATSKFPTGTVNSNNYWVDPVFYRPETPPTTPDLSAVTDSGASDSDNITNSTSPTFTGTARAGSTVTILADGVAVGSAVAAANHQYSVTLAPGALADGQYSVTAAVTTTGPDGLPMTLASPGALTLRIDRSALVSTPDLLASSDSGSSDTDNLTNAAAPVLAGTAGAGDTVTVFADGVSIGQTTADGSGNYQFAAGGLPEGTRQLTAQSSDAAGNTSALSSALAVTIDRTAPSSDVVDVTPDPRATAVDSVQVVASEPVTGLTVASLRLTRDGVVQSLAGVTVSGPAADGRTYTVSGLAPATSLAGAYVLSLPAAGSTLRDAAGNAPAADASDAWVMSATVNAAPALTSLSPASATDPVGTYRTFTAAYRDANGAADLAQVYLRVNDFIPIMLDCLYDAVANKLFVRSADGTTLLGGFAPGSANVISTTHGSLDCSQTTVSSSGTQMTVNWRVACSAPLNGPNVLYLRARDKGNPVLDSGYQRMNSGVWNVTGNTAPAAAAPAPLAPSSAVGVAQNFSVTYSDPDGWENLQNVYLRVNADLPWMLDAVYHVPSGRLYLRNATTGALLGGFVAGTNNVISNGHGSLDCSAVTVTHSGTDLTVNWNLTAGAYLAGPNRLFVRARDAAGGDSGYKEYAGAVWTVTGNAAPTLVSVTPASGTTAAGTARTLVGTYGDADGALNLNFLYLTLNANDPARRLQAVYNVQTNRLFLLADDGVSLLGNFAPGSNNVISNGRGSLNCAATNVSSTATRIVIAWSLTPAATLTGTNTVSLRARDRGGLDTGFQLMPGVTWNVT